MLPMHPISNAVIDPALLGEGESRHIAEAARVAIAGPSIPNLMRNPVITSDNLALHEARRFMVTGKRDRVRRKGI
jgi:hypothetical protein